MGGVSKGKNTNGINEGGWRMGRIWVSEGVGGRNLQVAYVESGGILERILGRLLWLRVAHLGIPSISAVSAMIRSSPFIL